MNVVLFGATGMVGQGVLRECLRDAGVERIVSVVRVTTANIDARVEELVCANFFDLAPLEDRLSGLDACLFTLGVSSAGLKEEAYRRVTYDITIHAATTLLRLNPRMTFLYVSGAGTDSSGNGRAMWARVKGQTENALLAMPFKAAYMFRPGFIQPLDGIISKTKAYRMLYTATAPITPLLRKLFPRLVTTTEELGKAMVRVAREGYSKAIIEAGELGTIVAAAGD